MMHAIAQLEIAERKIGVVDVAVKRVEFGLVDAAVLLDLAVQPLERLEVQSLVGVIQRLTEVQVLQLVTVTRACRQGGGQQQTEHKLWCSTH